MLFFGLSAWRPICLCWYSEWTSDDHLSASFNCSNTVKIIGYMSYFSRINVFKCFIVEVAATSTFLFTRLAGWAWFLDFSHLQIGTGKHYQYIISTQLLCYSLTPCCTVLHHIIIYYNNLVKRTSKRGYYLWAKCGNIFPVSKFISWTVSCLQ